MSFGAMMDYGGFNERLITPVIQRVKSDGGTIATVMLTSLGFNIVGGDQYIAIVLPARMFMLTFRKRGLASGNAGHGGREFRYGHLGADPLELVWRLPVGHAGGFDLCLLSLLFLQPDQPNLGLIYGFVVSTFSVLPRRSSRRWPICPRRRWSIMNK